MAGDIIEGVVVGIKLAVFLALLIYIGLILRAFKLKELWPMLGTACMLLLSAFTEFVYVISSDLGSPFSFFDIQFLSGILTSIAALGILTMFYFIGKEPARKGRKGR
ncbi:hypothetical protein HY546_00995 [archaeon]|nr:hypothetical protein [archaeon]